MTDVIWHHTSVKVVPSQISMQTKQTALLQNRLIRQQDDISCFALEYEDEKVKPFAWVHGFSATESSSCPKSLSIKNLRVYKHMWAQCDANHELLYTSPKQNFEKIFSPSIFVLWKRLKYLYKA